MRYVLVVALGWSLLGAAELAAEDLVSLRPAHRKAAIEKKLDQPLQWKLDARKHMTVAEFIEFVQEKHGLRIRWDAGSLALVQGELAPQMGLFAAPASQPTHYPTPYPSNPPAASPQFAPDIAYFPSPPESTKPKATSDQPPAAKPSGVPESPTLPAAPSPAAPLPTSPPGAAVTPPPLPAAPPTYFPLPAVVKPEAGGDETGRANELIASIATAPIAASAVSLEQATVREGLQQLLDALPSAAGASLQMGLPITTRALNLALLVDENSVLITTQLRANAAKETRIYRLNTLGAPPPETLVRVITHTVRPWSWRSQIHEIAGQLAARWPKTPLPLPTVQFNMTEGVTLAPTAGAGEAPAAPTLPIASEETVAATGQLLAGGAVAAVDTVVAALEIIHHGDPPTGVIEVLPGMLVITQSQGAHREIEALLDALGYQDHARRTK